MFHDARDARDDRHASPRCFTMPAMIVPSQSNAINARTVGDYENRPYGAVGTLNALRADHQDAAEPRRKWRES
jgi:hypothetical protein